MHRNNTQSQLDVIWEALHEFRSSCILEGLSNELDEEHDNQWNEICTAMAWIEEDLMSN
jgi:hypothetical protein